MFKKYLLTPGPTPVPERIRLAMAAEIMHHRTPQFSAIFAEARRKLALLFGTKEEVLIHAASGSGAMEASIVNLLSAGDEVVYVNGGKFGERWGKIAKAYGITAHEIKVEWGHAVTAEAVKQALAEHPKAKAVLMQGSETSTTACHPVKEIAKVTAEHDNTLLIVDGITAVGVFPLPMDEYGIDVLITGSQKALMLPPGLAFMAYSQKAQAMAASSTLPKFYFSMASELKAHKQDTTAWTPAVSLIVGLNVALDMMLEETLEGVFARHARLANATRAAVTALGMKLLAPDAPADGVTGVYIPEGVDGGKLVKQLRDGFGVSIAGGQDHLKGKIVRIAHMGHMEAFDTIIAISALEMALKKNGADIQLGKGVAAAQEILLSGF